MRTTWVAVLLLLAGCSDDKPDASPTTSTTAPAAPTSTTTPRPRVEPLQVAGSWVVSEAGANAQFPVGTRVAFAGDGTFTAGSQAGTWRVRDAELDLFAGPTMYGYTATASPRELRLGVGPVGMVLVRA